MTESGVEPEFVNLRMSVVGYEVEYRRNKTDATGGFHSEVTLLLSVKGAMVEHYQNAPVNRVVVDFPEAPETDKLGRLFDSGDGALIRIQLPETNFPPLWAALRLDRVATLACSIIRPPAPEGWTGDDVVSFEVSSRGSLFPLFGA